MEEKIEKLTIACEALLRAYALGEGAGGDTDWENLDSAFAAAQDALPGRYEEILLDVSDEDEDEDEDDPQFLTGVVHDIRATCPACGSVEQRLIGALGNTVHLRCADCGNDHSFEARV